MEWFTKAAEEFGWEILSPPQVHEPQGLVPGSHVVVGRGPEIIDMEISSGGIPHKIDRTLPDGTTQTIPFLQIRMSDVLGWMDTPPPEDSVE